MDAMSCEQVCRICASHGPDYASIFNENSNGISEKINQCLPISVSEYDRLPLHICSECLNDLLVSYELREKSLKSEKQSSEQFNSNGINIKSEKDHNADDNDLTFCAICGINFDNTVQFNGHMKEFHLSEWKCNLCEENFKTSGDLFQHKYTNHYDNMNDFAEAGGNIDKLASERDASINADESINRKDRGPPSTTDNSLKTRPTLKTLIICDICNVSVNNEKEMVYHRTFHAPRVVMCWVCDIEYESSYDYYLHTRNFHKHHVGQVKKFCCEKCGTFVSDFKVFKRHINCEFVKPKCPYCERELRTRVDLIIHKKKFHQEDMEKDLNTKKWNCAVCEKVFVYASDYRKHRHAHKKGSNIGRHKCEQCDRLFSTPSLLKIHVEGSHEQRPKYKCELCLKLFRTTRNLWEHRKRHRDQTCKECDKQFENFQAHSLHMKEVHNVPLAAGGRFACKQCPRSFQKMRLLQDHENTHSGKKPYSCDICNRRFRTYAAKWSHDQSHRSEPYVCDYCKQEFKNKGRMARHILGHMPPETWQFECEMCKTKFKTTTALKNHMKVYSESSKAVSKKGLRCSKADK